MPVMQSINPATGRLIRDYAAHDRARVEAILRAAESAFISWRGRSFADRAGLMRAAAATLRAQRQELAQLMTAEMGKPIAAAEAEVDKCASACDYFADHAERFLAPEPVESDAARSFVRFDPLGPVLAIMPWNFPLWQVFRFAAPALMAGNVGLLKHASNVAGCALAIERIFLEAGFPEGAFSALLVGGKEAQELIAHPAIRAVTLTGSETAGMAVAAAAGRALKKTVLELGGSDPFIVLDDVDVSAVASAAAAARCINSGQSCIAAKRFIIHRAIAAPFEEAFAAAMARLKVGDPADRGTDVGPLARPDLRDDLHQQVQRSIAAGARLLTGGQALAGDGYYYAPTVLADVRPGMAAFDEETFGPVAAVVRAGDADEAVALANASKFGLGASIWTRDTGLAEKMASRIESGSVFVNGPVKSDPRLPFGGVKYSGYGRELSEIGIREFVNIKTVWVKQ
jgi:succinate-semialdehyde dehydrogenase / glutarate-semialdehyde dehydrogenase